MSLVGGLQDRGGGLLSVTYDHCSYTSTFFPPGNLLNPPTTPGVQVLDVSNPAQPVLSTTLNEPAMLGGTWESLKVNKARKLLAATAVPIAAGTGYFSVYDISDCATPPDCSIVVPVATSRCRCRSSPMRRLLAGRQHLLGVRPPRTGFPHRHRHQ